MRFFLFLCLAALGSAVDLTCPKGPIDKSTVTGKFPSDGIATFPQDFSCGIQFLIPDGWIVKFVSQSNAVPGVGDQLAIIDSTNRVNVQAATGESVFYAPANQSWVTISTRTANSQFFFRWQFVDVSSFGKKQMSTGTTLQLNLSPLNFYQFTSPVGPVTFHTADVNNQFDLNLVSIYVYDGDSLTSGKYLGNLWQFTNADTMQKSSGKSLVLVNFYAYTTSSYGVANDYDAVSKYSSYRLIMLNDGISFQGHVNKPSGPSSSSAVTFLCRDCQEAYLTGLSIIDRNVDDQLVQFKPATPSDAYPVLLKYGAKDALDEYLPQQIPTNLFTMTVANCEVSLFLAAGSLATWQVPFSGRKGFIYPPSVWNTIASPNYNTTFTSSDMYTFIFDLDYVEVTQPGQKIRIEVGSAGAAPTVVQFSETTDNPGGRAINGTYWSTVSSANSFGMKFEMKLIDNPTNPTLRPRATTPGPMTFPTVTSPKPTAPGRGESTTMSAAVPFQLLSLTVIVAKLAMGC